MLLQKIKDIMHQKLQGDYSFGPYGGVEGIDEAAAEIEQLLQQTPCSTLREEVEQMLSNAFAARDFATMAQNEAKHMKATERLRTLSDVLKLIDKLSPVA